MTQRDDPGKPQARASLGVLRKLTEQAANRGPRLAQLEFESLLREIEAGGWQQLVLAFDRPNVGKGALLTPPPILAASPVLQVPLGRIAWVPQPEHLPVVAIDVPALPAGDLTAQLLLLLSEHHRKPFMRLVFLSETTAPLALLGRYGFAVICRGDTPAIDIAQAEAARLKLSELRRLSDAAVLWRA
ncbi:MAG: hypothetical protein ABI832_13470 [bacterium]